MIKAEILSVTGGMANIALYYEIADNVFNPASVDPSRNPQGQRLTAQEVDLLRNGTLYEYVVTVAVKGKDSATLRSSIEGIWAANAIAARDAYASAYGYEGARWDNTGWSLL